MHKVTVIALHKKRELFAAQFGSSAGLVRE
jgi:hypothetical protein